MISLEQVLLLETRIGKAIDYIKTLESEKEDLLSHNKDLQEKVDSNQKRIDELEVLAMRFKEDQGRIEDGIIAALDRLSQFEEAFENSLKEKFSDKKAGVKVSEKQEAQEEIFFEISENEEAALQKSGELSTEDSADIEKPEKQPEQAAKDLSDFLSKDKNSSDKGAQDSSSASEGEKTLEGELDIF